MTWGEYLNNLAAIAGKEPIKRKLSKPSALLLGKLMMALHCLFGVEPLVTPMAVEVFTNQKIISIENAQKLLGYRPRVSFEEGMERVKMWLQEEGYI